MPRQAHPSLRRKVILTASMVRTYKACPRLYELEYIHQLKPVTPSEALTNGSQYHDFVAKILSGEEYRLEGIAGTMAAAFDRFLPWREWGIKAVEQEFSARITPYFYLRGKIDAVCEDGCIVEHKTTRNTLDDMYLERLALDDQVSIYLAAQTLLSDKLINRVHYTAVQKPTIRQKQNETDSQFQERVREWYDETRVKSFTVVRTFSQIEETIDHLKELAKEIRRRKFWYRNPAHCMIVDCPYRSICLDCDPQTLTGFVKKENNNEELSPCKF